MSMSSPYKRTYVCPSCGEKYIPHQRGLLCPSCYADDVHETVFHAMNLLQEEMQKCTDLNEEKKMIEILDNAFIDRKETEAIHLKNIVLMTFKANRPQRYSLKYIDFWKILTI